MPAVGKHLNENPRQLARPNIDIIGPAQPKRAAFQPRCNRVHQGNTNGQGQSWYGAGWKSELLWVDEQAECQASLASPPAIVGPAAAGGLSVRHGQRGRDATGFR